MLLENHNAISEGGYPIANSLRFQSASATYATRVFGTPTNQRKFTYSLWVKLGLLSINSNLLGACTGATNDAYFQIYSNQLVFGSYTGVGQDYGIKTAAVFRDPSAWYHVVCVFDTANATAADRAIIYINGIRQTVTNAANGMFPLNFTNLFNSAVTHGIGIRPTYGDYQLDAYIAEVNFIDGQALTPSSFGETNTLTGQWVAKKYTGTYGTNGFYLPFSNGTSTTTLGYDSSGNSNNWTLNNFTRSAGVSDCWMYDVPSGNGSSVGNTQPNSNYSVLNRLVAPSTWYATYNSFTRGNLTTTGTSGWTSSVFGNMGVSSGKWYWETVMTVKGGQPFPNGIQNLNNPLAVGYPGSSGTTGSWGFYSDGAQIYNAGSATSYGSTFAVNDVCGAALDLDAGTLTLYKNGVSMGVAVSGLPSGLYVPAASAYDGTLNFNFGQRSFAYTPPSGFKALCTANLPTATIKKGNTVFDATLYTGTGSAKSVTNAAGFSPDFVWLKNRSHNDADPYYGVHLLYNTIAGAGNRLMSQSTAAEAYSSQSLTSFNSNGFSIGTDASVNYNGDAFVAWQWDAGSSTVTNTNGTISSQVRANPTAGVSVVTFTGTGTTATVGHGLGVAPKMIIFKGRNAATDWGVYHVSLGATGAMFLDLKSAFTTASGYFNNTAPTSSVMTVGGGVSWCNNTSSSTHVAYCFAEIAGFSRFGSYTGNGSTDGPFIFTGFRPKFVMWKRTDAAESWVIEDTSRNTYNVANAKLYAQDPSAEDTNATYGLLDILSNGFKCRTAHAQQNASGGTYIYMAFAENPFQHSNAR